MGVNSDPQTLHKYLYTHADPVNNIDPTGNYTLGSLSRAQKIAVGLLLAAAADVSFDSLVNFNTAADGEFNRRQRGFSVLAAMAGAGSKMLALVTSKLATDSEGRIIMYHGSSIESAVALLNGVPLSIASALENKFPGEGSPLGFYLTPQYEAAAFFGIRRKGGVILSASQLKRHL